MIDFTTAHTSDGGCPAVDEPIVQYWENELRAGRPIPAPVFMRRQSGELVIVEGRNKVVAARRFGVEVTAYVIEEMPTEAVQQMLDRANASRSLKERLLSY